MSIIHKLAELAGKLDKRGLYQSADTLDKIIIEALGFGGQLNPVQQSFSPRSQAKSVTSLQNDKNKLSLLERKMISLLIDPMLRSVESDSEFNKIVRKKLEEIKNMTSWVEASTAVNNYVSPIGNAPKLQESYRAGIRANSANISEWWKLKNKIKQQLPQFSPPNVTKPVTIQLDPVSKLSPAKIRVQNWQLKFNKYLDKLVVSGLDPDLILPKLKPDGSWGRLTGMAHRWRGYIKDAPQALKKLYDMFEKVYGSEIDPNNKNALNKFLYGALQDGESLADAISETKIKFDLNNHTEDSAPGQPGKGQPREKTRLDNLEKTDFEDDLKKTMSYLVDYYKKLFGKRLAGPANIEAQNYLRKRVKSGKSLIEAAKELRVKLYNLSKDIYKQKAEQLPKARMGG